MSLAPLLQASPVIQLHAFAAMTAFMFGTIELAARKGALPHRVFGSAWVLLMPAVCVGTFFIHRLRVWGEWSPIHLLAIFTLAMLPLAVWQAHRHAVEKHQPAMLGLFFGALIVARLFTFWPGRIMYAVVFGG
jgi:uncharacterized membrane protein